jgi:aspartyl-tRNA(Asn)/glutamyl-tRNA(Gln) amidotransferase subunit C
LSAILAYVETLNELDTSAVPPAAQVIRLANVTRPDEVTSSLSVEAALANAPDRSDNVFAVPPVFENE